MELKQMTSSNGMPQTFTDLVELIAERLEQKCNDLPEWRWQVDFSVDLKSLSETDGEQARRLLFGNVDEVHNAMTERYGDGLLIAQREVVRGVLEGLLTSEFRDLVQNFADQEGCDLDDLLAELKSDGALSAEAFEAPACEYAFSYEGTASVVAPVGLTATFTPGEDLTGALLRLRIAPHDYLAACASLIESQEYTTDNMGPFEEAIKAACFGDLAGMTLGEAYEAAFWQSARCSNDGGLYSECSLGGRPAVSVVDLVDAMMSWGGPRQLYLHTACTGETVKQVSNEIECHSLNLANTQVKVYEGVLAPETNPDHLDATVGLISPVVVNARLFDVRPEDTINVGRELTLCDTLRPGCMLYRTLMDIPEQSDLQAVALDNTADKLFATADLVPRFLAEKTAARIESLGNKAVRIGAQLRHRLLQRASELTEAERKTGLLEALAPASTGLDRWRQRAYWLIEAGSDVNTTMANGVTPLMLACRELDAELASALINAGADVNATCTDALSGARETALSIAARNIMQGRKSLPANACVQVLLQAGAKLPSTRLKVGAGSDKGIAPLVFAVCTGIQSMIEQTAHDLILGATENVQRDLNASLYAAATNTDLGAMGTLLGLGADPHGAVETSAGQIRSVIEAVRNPAESESGFVSARITESIALLQAHAARTAITRVQRPKRSA